MHIRSISSDIFQKVDIQFGLLIAINCTNAMEPTKIMRSEDGLYIYRTRLGWCVVETINCKSEGKTTSCNWILIKDVASSKLASNHFKIEM